MNTLGQETRYKMWLEVTAKPFAKKHDMSLASVVSLIMYDSYKPGPQYKDLFAWVENEDFADRLNEELKQSI